MAEPAAKRRRRAEDKADERNIERCGVMRDLADAVSRSDVDAIRSWLDRHPRFKVGERTLECCGAMRDLPDELFFSLMGRAWCGNYAYASALVRGPEAILGCVARGLRATTDGKAFEALVVNDDIETVRAMLEAKVVEMRLPAAGECTCMAAYARSPGMMALLLESNGGRHCGRAGGSAHVNVRRRLAAARGDDTALSSLDPCGVPPIGEHVSEKTPVPRFRDADHFRRMLADKRHFTDEYLFACAVAQCAGAKIDEVVPGSLAKVLMESVPADAVERVYCVFEGFPTGVANFRRTDLRSATHMIDMFDDFTHAWMQSSWLWPPSTLLVARALDNMRPQNAPLRRLERIVYRYPRQVFQELSKLGKGDGPFMCTRAKRMLEHTVRLETIARALSRWRDPRPADAYGRFEIHIRGPRNHVQAECDAVSAAMDRTVGIPDLANIACEYLCATMPPL